MEGCLAWEHGVAGQACPLRGIVDQQAAPGDLPGGREKTMPAPHSRCGIWGTRSRGCTPAGNFGEGTSCCHVIICEAVNDLCFVSVLPRI